MLRGYFDAVHEATIQFVRTVTDSDLDRIVDERWDPPVTLGIRLVSVFGHNFEQTAQAAYVRGILERKEHHPRRCPCGYHSHPIRPADPRASQARSDRDLLTCG